MPQSVEFPLILSLDIGSSSIRAILYDRAGRFVEGMFVQEPVNFIISVEGVAELDPEALFERITHCIDRILAHAGDLTGQICAVAVATFVSNIMAVDTDNKPLSPLISYADTRNTADAEALQRTLDEAQIQQRTGCLLRTSYYPARLNWFRRVDPEIWQTTARWLSLGEYLELRLFGHCRVSCSVASWSGLLDRQSLQWDAALLETLAIRPEQLSPLVDVNQPLRGLLQVYAKRWPALHDVAWLPAIGDGAAANLGSGCFGRDRVALTIGTSGALRVILDQVERVPAGLWCYRVDQRRVLLGGATSEGGNVYAWLKQTMQLPTHEQIEAALAIMPPDSHGLTILPFWAGERSPNWAGDVPATIHGITLATTPLAIVRASLEAIAYRFSLIEQRIASYLDADYQLIASGTALLSTPTWMQIMSDVLNRVVIASTEPEATSRGTALLGLESLGLIESIEALPIPKGTVYYPNPTHHKVYQAAIERQQWLYDRCVDDRRR